MTVVKEGVYLGQTLYNNQGKVLLMKGTKLTKRYIDKIKEHGFYTIYIIDKYSQQELQDIIKPQIRRKAIDSVRNIYNSFSRLQDGSLNVFRRKELEKESISSIEEMQIMAKTIVDDIFSHPELLVSLVDIKSLDTYTFNHSVSVGVLALTLGISSGLNRNDLYDLTLGCMLHDVGKIFIPTDILNKKDRLSTSEFEVIKEHCEKGFSYLRDNTDLGPRVRIVALQHQERFDGSGYPQGLKGDKINKLAQIASVADVYDALTSHRPYRMALPPHEAIEYMMASGGTHFNMELIKTFLSKIIPFPVGTVVELSNGFIGTVEKLNDNMLLRPVIKIFKLGDEELNPFMCDLSRENNIVIKNIVYDI